MKVAVQFGAGNIGRGFMGQLFWEAGYKTYFIEYNEQMVNLLNESGTYPLRLLDAYTKKNINLKIDRFEAICSKEHGRVADLFRIADVAGTAVGVQNLDSIAPSIAMGIRKRRSEKALPIDIYLCENTNGAGKLLQDAVFRHLSSEEQEWAKQNVGFVATSVARMVPAADKRFEHEGPLFVVADSYHKLPYDGTARRASEPSIEGLKSVSNFKAEVERKLYTHNLGHAVMGYIGYLKGYTYVHESFSDDYLSSVFDGALNETAQALVRMYPDDIDPQEHNEIIQDVHVRFGNPMLLDSLTRVARDPKRKLSANDRLIGSAKMCLSQGVFPKYIAFICGAAYCYDAPDDPGAMEIQQLIRAGGIESALQKISQEDPNSDLGKEIIKSYYKLLEFRKKWGKIRRDDNEN